jgi:RNA-directed DNA polymerase
VEGTPQGGVISPLLANVCLNGLETGLERHLKSVLGFKAAKSSKVNLVRYADDFVITGASKELLENIVKPWIEQFLQERGLKLSPEKTKIVHIQTGFDFLGWNFRKYGDKLLIKPSRKNVKAFYDKVKGVITSALHVPQGELIEQLNPILKGWAEYHKGVVAKATFTKLDHLIWWKLFRWGKRRHPRKTGKWIVEAYWHRKETRLDFQRNDLDEDGSPYQQTLIKLADTKIVRWKKVKGEFNPYLPRWEGYAEELRMQRGQSTIWHAQKLKLWLEQAGRCALCEQELDDREEGWHDHHIIFKMHGGSDALSNRVLLHPICHRRIHTLGLEVSKPVSST